MIQAFKQVRLTNNLLSGSGSALVYAGVPLAFVNQTGQFITTAQTGGFGGGGVTNVNVSGVTINGSVTITGINGIGVSLSGSAVIISGNSLQTGQFITTAQTGQYAPAGMTGQFITTAQTGLFYPASNPNNYITAAQAGGVSAVTVTGASVSGNVNFTGLRGINVSLSGSYVLISGGDTGQFISTAMTGQFVDSAHTGGFVSISQTGQFVTTAMTGILGIWTGNQQSFSTAIYTGIDFTGILFPSVFPTVPRAVQVTIEVTGDIMYGATIRNRTVSGYTAMFSDTIQESGVVLHTLANL